MNQMVPLSPLLISSISINGASSISKVFRFNLNFKLLFPYHLIVLIVIFRVDKKVKVLAKISKVSEDTSEFRTFKGWDEGVLGMQVGEVARLTDQDDGEGKEAKDPLN
ncbi:uncharacterized protein LOC104908072 [Beta vulgaris subsp. vulgaris]|uniref:uncharacterized protein LOC104908072 n=1 Tax=Beta vulgaris subsp. vulgaris TaxID=3555 RepID=UPI00053FDC94|nr:uncharacterized protein LOC104908072 [Beta vulgaris subsp. vulgaris]